jgi:hypothetical protein
VWGLLKEANFFIWPLFVTSFSTPTFPLFIFLSCFDFGDTNGLKDFFKYKGIYFPFPILQKDPLGFYNVIMMKTTIGHMTPSPPPPLPLEKVTIHATLT